MSITIQHPRHACSFNVIIVIDQQMDKNFTINNDDNGSSMEMTKTIKLCFATLLRVGCTLYL